MNDTTAQDAATCIDATVWLTPRQVGEIIGKSKWAVHAMIRGGHLGARRIGNRWKISGAHVNALLTGADNQPAADAS